MSKSVPHFIIIFLVLLNPISGQEKILEFSADYEDTPFIMQSSFTMVNELNEDFTVFLTKKSDISAYYFNNSMEFKGRLLSRQLPNKYKLPLGGTIDDTKYTLFYTNPDKSKFAGIVFDFDSRWSNVFEIDLKLKNEVFLTQFNHSNKLHLLTASYRENYLYLYILGDAGAYQKKTIDLSMYEFLGGAAYPTKLKYALTLGTALGPLAEVQWIQNDIDYSLDSLCTWYKLYIEDDKLFLVIDLNREFTQIIDYNLTTEIAGYTRIPQPKFKNEGSSNSYMLDGKLFQFKANSQEMALKISEIESKTILKEHHISKKDSLEIAIGSIQQRGGRYDKHREFDKTSKFLRKVGASNPAIFVKENEGVYQINMGSVEEIDNTMVYLLAAVNPFSVVAVFGSVTFFANPVALAFYRASNTRAVYISSLLDSNFEKTIGKEPQHVFYTIQDHIEKEDIKRFTASDIFKYNGAYLFGRLDRKTRNYSLLKFEAD